MNELTINYLKKIDKPIIGIFLILFIYLLCTILVWKKYSYEPTSMVHFGEEFVLQNIEYMPNKAVVEKGYEGDLGAGYDGQIFYFYSRTINSLTQNWPKGFDESYRAPRIGYPLLISFFGIFGPLGNLFAMYFWNISLFLLSYLALREILEEHSYLSFFYITSPFALGSYSVLVSDTVMLSLVVLSYYFYIKEKYIIFIIISSLSILTKEPSLFLYFPLGIKEILDKRWKNAIIIGSILIIPITWQTYLKWTFPNWKPNRLVDFVTPIEGLTTYFTVLVSEYNKLPFKDLLRLLSRLPLFVLLIVGIVNVFSGTFKKGLEFRIGLSINLFMILVASYYHFWSVYENVSRMFTISILFVILLVKDDGLKNRIYYLNLSFLLFLLFFIKLIFIQKAQVFTIWTR